MIKFFLQELLNEEKLGRLESITFLTHPFPLTS